MMHSPEIKVCEKCGSTVTDEVIICLKCKSKIVIDKRGIIRWVKKFPERL